MPRTFISLPVPTDVAKELNRLQAELDAALPRSSVGWTRRDQIHLTLHFLGELPEDKVRAVEMALHGVCANAAPMRLRAERVGFFPSARRPRIIWTAVEDATGQLLPLQSAISREIDVLLPLGQQEEKEKGFRAHLTIGRVREISPREARALVEFAHRSVDRNFGEWTASSVELMRSDLSPQGSKYTLLASFALAGAAQVPKDVRKPKESPN